MIGVTMGSVVVAGLLLTFVCAYFSVNRHLSMTREEAILY